MTVVMMMMMMVIMFMSQRRCAVFAWTAVTRVIKEITRLRRRGCKKVSCMFLNYWTC